MLSLTHVFPPLDEFREEFILQGNKQFELLILTLFCSSLFLLLDEFNQKRVRLFVRLLKWFHIQICFSDVWCFPHSLALEALLAVCSVFLTLMFIDFPCSLGLNVSACAPSIYLAECEIICFINQSKTDFTEFWLDHRVVVESHTHNSPEETICFQRQVVDTNCAVIFRFS